MPTWIPDFVFKIDNITTGDPDPEPVNGFWRPSCNTRSFQRTTSTSFYRWRNGALEPVSASCRLTRYSVASVFYQAETARFLAVPYDCQEQILDRAGRAWHQLGFEYRNNNNISILGCDGFGQPYLAAPGSPPWMPELLPSVYDRPSGYDPPEHNDRGGLAGSLSLLIALAAFAYEPVCMIDGINYSFKIPKWISHQRPGNCGSEISRQS